MILFVEKVSQKRPLMDDAAMSGGFSIGLWGYCGEGLLFLEVGVLNDVRDQLFFFDTFF